MVQSAEISDKFQVSSLKGLPFSAFLALSASLNMSSSPAAEEAPSQSNPQVVSQQQALFSHLEMLWEENDRKTFSKSAKRIGGETLIPGRTSEGGAINAPSTGLSPEMVHADQNNAAGRRESDGSEFRHTNIGVFPDDEFRLCGHSRFTARLTGKPPTYEAVIIKSRDRTIPDIPFRGLSVRVPLETRSDLFAGCSVIAGFVQVAGVVRIGLSVREYGDSE